MCNEKRIFFFLRKIISDVHFFRETALNNDNVCNLFRNIVDHCCCKSCCFEVVKLWLSIVKKNGNCIVLKRRAWFLHVTQVSKKKGFYIFYNLKCHYFSV